MCSRFYKLSEPVEKMTEKQLLALRIFKEKLTNGIYNFESSDCLCGDKNGILLAGKDRYALDVKTYLCKNCGLMRTNPRLSKDSLEKFYENEYRAIYVGYAKAPDEFFQEQVRHGKNIYDFVNKCVSFQDGEKVVYDIGCGAGGVLVEFIKNNWSGYGCDLGSDYLEKGKEEGLTLEHGNAGILSKYSKADIIILSHVLEHLINPVETIKQISEMLKDNGYIYIELPGILNIIKSYGDFLLFLQNAHLYHFTLKSLTDVMNKAGFSIIIADESIKALYRKENGKLPEINYDKGQYKIIYRYLFFAEIYRRFRFVFHGISITRKFIVIFLRKTFGNDFVDKLKSFLI